MIAGILLGGVACMSLLVAFICYIRCKRRTVGGAGGSRGGKKKKDIVTAIAANASIAVTSDGNKFSLSLRRNRDLMGGGKQK